MNLLTFTKSLLLLAAIGVDAVQNGQPKLSRKQRAAALRDAHFGNPNTEPSNTLQSRDLKPSEAGLSYHWAGAVVPPPSATENITSVTATMTLPELTVPDGVREGPSGEYFLYVWVGIDGLESVDPGECDSLWQTGFAGQIVDGVTTWWGWVCYLWDGEEHAVFDTHILDASSGDTVNMTVQALNSSEGTFWLDNLSTGDSTSYNVTGGGLCMEQAEWIVENPWAGNTETIRYMLVWPDFGTMTFDDAVAYTDQGTIVTPTGTGSTLYVVESYEDNSIVQNNVSVTDGTVSVTWLESGPATKLGADAEV
ncbi:unnamed protein product [Discula destructiva]